MRPEPRARAYVSTAGFTTTDKCCRVLHLRNTCENLVPFAIYGYVSKVMGRRAQRHHSDQFGSRRRAAYHDNASVAATFSGESPGENASSMAATVSTFRNLRECTDQSDVLDQHGMAPYHFARRFPPETRRQNAKPFSRDHHKGPFEAFEVHLFFAVVLLAVSRKAQTRDFRCKIERSHLGPLS